MVIKTIKTEGLTLDKLRAMLGFSARFIGYKHSKKTLNSVKRYRRRYKNISKSK